LLWIAMATSTAPGCLHADVQKVELGPDAGAGGALTGKGGAIGSGGAKGMGGTSGMGGTTGSGGAIGIGGTPGSGGAAGKPGSGGTTGAGGEPIVDAGSGTTPSAAGQLIFTELMADTTAAKDEVGEWVEIYNPSLLVTYDLFGCQLYDSANTDTITRHVILRPGYFVTLARSIDPTLGFVPTDIYPTVKFSNTGDLAGLRCGGTAIDVVDFTTWPVPKGHSFSLSPQHYDGAANDLPANWCQGSMVYNTIIDEGGTQTDYGSPGVTNPPCP
jgi:hypothetical protein